jgi:hypothetical protein
MWPYASNFHEIRDEFIDGYGLIQTRYFRDTLLFCPVNNMA